jgi:hypothetical protein
MTVLGKKVVYLMITKVSIILYSINLNCGKLAFFFVVFQLIYIGDNEPLI